MNEIERLREIYEMGMKVLCINTFIAILAFIFFFVVCF